MDRNLKFIQKVFYILVIVVLSFIILKEAKQFLYPIALALLAAYLLYPLASFFEKKLKIPRAISIIITIILAITFFYFTVNIFYFQIKVLIRDFPIIKQNALSNLESIQHRIAERSSFSIAEQNLWVQKKIATLLDQSDELLKKFTKGATGTIEALLFIPIFVFFMLLYRDRGKEFILKLASRNNKLTNDLLEQISQVTVKYMAGVITVVIILAISHSVALSIIGVKYAIFLGIFAATLSFIPYFGTLFSALIPLTFSLIMSSNPYQPFVIILYFIFITFIDHNILTPTITGGNVNLNPLVTILGLILAAEIWGIPGMIIIVPILGVIKIILDNVEGWEPYGYILGANHHGIDFKKLRKKILKKRKVKNK